MGAPVPEMEPVENASAELLDSLKTISAAERRKHATVFNYWHSIRGNRQFPPIRDLDPLEISDAGPFSVLLEMIGGGEDAEIRHLGQSIKTGEPVERVGQAPNPSLLACIHAKLPIVAACRQAYAFEDEFDDERGTTRCWVTLLPFSATGTWIDYVYGFVSLDPSPDEAEQAPEPIEEAPGTVDEALEVADAAPEPIEEAGEAAEDAAAEPEPTADGKPGFSAKLIQGLTSVGFYGKLVEVEPELPSAPFAEDEPETMAEPEDVVTDEPEEAPEPESAAPEEPVAAQEDAIPEPEIHSATEGALQDRLADVRAKADEARQAKLRSNLALYEGLSAAYDFALDAEDQAEDYLKLVEAQGLKIQLRSPMTPVARLAFGGMCDDSVIPQLEAVLAWAFKNDLPRGSLAERIEAEGGIGPILNGQVAE
jgi:hypothetical protein